MAYKRYQIYGIAMEAGGGVVLPTGWFKCKHAARPALIHHRSRPLGDAKLRYERNLSKHDCHSHENGNPDSEYLGLDSRVRGNDRSKSRRNRNYSVSN